MTKRERVWLFTELVKDTSDPEQLIAYAIYKANKNDLAKQCRLKTAMSDSEIATELQHFHDQITLSALRQQGYRTKAREMLDELAVGIGAKLQHSWQQRLQHLEGDLWIQWGDCAKRYSENVRKVQWHTALIKWIGGGLTGLLATALSTVLVVGVVSLFTSDLRGNARQSLKSVIEVLIPAQPFGVNAAPETYRELPEHTHVPEFPDSQRW